MEGKFLALNVSAPVASFRRPLDHNYQRTLPLPPPTTLIGLAGAALGLSDRQLWAEKSPLCDLKVSVLAQPSYHTGGDPGKAQDMWTVMKIKNNRIAERSPYLRELLFFGRYTLLYGGTADLLEELYRAFLDPAYPLSLGREDELIWIEGLPEITQLVEGTPRFSGTAIPGDLRDLEVKAPPLRPGLRFEPPVVETVPIAFTLNRRGVREPLRRVSLTFIPLSLKLEVPEISPVFSYKGRNFTWLNS